MQVDCGHGMVDDLNDHPSRGPGVAGEQNVLNVAAVRGARRPAAVKERRLSASAVHVVHQDWEGAWASGLGHRAAVKA